MRHRNRSLVIGGFALVATALALAYAHKAPPADDQVVVTDQQKEATEVAANQTPPATEVKSQIVLTEPEKEAVAAFNKRTSEYANLCKKINASLPALPDKATSEQIDKHQKSMISQLRKERENARPGEFFTPAMVALVKRASAATVAGTDGKNNKQMIMDENPGTLPNVTVNDQYPDDVPMTSMPPELLETLPKLPEGQEYRFLGKRLILVDASCQLVLDVTPDVLA